MERAVFETQRLCTAAHDGARTTEEMVWDRHHIDPLLHPFEAGLQVATINVQTVGLPTIKDSRGRPEACGGVDGCGPTHGTTERERYRRPPKGQRRGAVEVLLSQHLRRYATQLIGSHPRPCLEDDHIDAAFGKFGSDNGTTRTRANDHDLTSHRRVFFEDIEDPIIRQRCCRMRQD